MVGLSVASVQAKAFRASVDPQSSGSVARFDVGARFDVVARSAPQSVLGGEKTLLLQRFFASEVIPDDQTRSYCDFARLDSPQLSNIRIVGRILSVSTTSGANIRCKCQDISPKWSTWCLVTRFFSPESHAVCSGLGNSQGQASICPLSAGLG